MDYRFVQNGLQIYLVLLKNTWDEGDKWETLIPTGFIVSPLHNMLVGQMGQKYILYFNQYHLNPLLFKILELA